MPLTLFSINTCFSAVSPSDPPSRSTAPSWPSIIGTCSSIGSFVALQTQLIQFGFWGLEVDSAGQQTAWEGAGPGLA